MKKYFVLFILFFWYASGFSQGKYFTRTGKINFSSNATLERIEGRNKTVIAVLDAAAGNIRLVIQMKSFEFDKALMQKHFNENYIESDKYPKSEFIGSIINNSDIDYGKNGSYKVIVKGNLTIHGITKEIEIAGNLEINENRIKTVSTFKILLSDYKVSNPSLVRQKISNWVTITADCVMEQLN